VIGPRDVIADRLRRVPAKEDGARVAHALQPRLRIGDGDFQMLGGDAVGQQRRVFELFDKK